jgi:hypothetical protein
LGGAVTTASSIADDPEHPEHPEQCAVTSHMLTGVPAGPIWPGEGRC